jgi:hypothetical protein
MEKFQIYFSDILTMLSLQSQALQLKRKAKSGISKHGTREERFALRFPTNGNIARTTYAMEDSHLTVGYVPLCVLTLVK